MMILTVYLATFNTKASKIYTMSTKKTAFGGRTQSFVAFKIIFASTLCSSCKSWWPLCLNFFTKRLTITVFWKSFTSKLLMRLTYIISSNTQKPVFLHRF